MWNDIKEKLPPRHMNVLFRCSNGDVYQGRPCYGMHEPYWCGHSELNFGVVLADKGLTVTHWAEIPPVGGRFEDGRVLLKDCPVGLFLWKDQLCLKTDYGTNSGRIDAYIVSSGEMFWGGTDDPKVQRNLLVTPVKAR